MEVVKTPWGSWVVLDQGPDFKVKRLTIHPGEMTSYQYHEHRVEYWNVVEGRGLAIVGDMPVSLMPDMAVFVRKGSRHRIVNTAVAVNLIIIEVQWGQCVEEDIIRISDKYNRVKSE